MVRLVFRPYTQVWRSICTSEPLRASIRVSPDFTLLRHSSPSFGSQRICSDSNLFPKIRIGRWCKSRDYPTSFSFLTRLNLIVFQTLTYTLHSLVRVQDGVILSISFMSWTFESFEKVKWMFQIPQSFNCLFVKRTITRSKTSPFLLNFHNLWKNSHELWNLTYDMPILTNKHNKLPTHCSKTVALQTISSSFDSLFRVLFIFPSRYLFAIGLSSVFSLRWNLPPT